ncbi:N-acetylmuramidase family protein [Desulfosarcina sp. OttesenSCG-928-G10]|nr:N-acetylmuramidase family protein [Desulfosarcina sp. OttesenSCG-928-G10]
MAKTEITWDDIVRTAKKLNVEPCALKAVCVVETSGSGFLPSGRPKILFEGHTFWGKLIKRGINPESYAPENPDIVYPKWTKQHYKGGEREYERLDRACKIHEEAALSSASWGAFQIMGFNYKACGYPSVGAFVDAQKAGSDAQLYAFCAFIKAKNLVRHLKSKDWALFAEGYNGTGYAANQYDKKLAAAYEKCRKKEKIEG